MTYSTIHFYPTFMLIRYFAAVRSAIGVSEETVSDSDKATIQSVEDLTQWVINRHPNAATPGGTAIRDILGTCSFLAEGTLISTDSRRPLPPVDVIDIIPPYCGG